MACAFLSCASSTTWVSLLSLLLPHLSSFYVSHLSSSCLLGFCLIAVSLLPLKKGSLKYGSSDGGVTVHTDDPKLNDVLMLPFT